MRIVITDYDTVQLISEYEVKKELKIKEFLNFFEKEIKNNGITRCKYNLENNNISFCYNNCDYVIKLENTNSGIGVALINLVKLYEDLERQRKYEEGLLSDARCGIIRSEDGRKLYVKELKESIGFKENLRKMKEIFTDCLDDCYDKNGACSTLVGVLSTLSGFSGIIVFFFALARGHYIHAFWSFIIISLSIALTISACKNIKPFKLIFKWIYRCFKEIGRDINLTRHKIKSLEKKKMSKRDMFNDGFDKKVNERMLRIYEKLESISQDKGIALKEVWLNKRKEFASNQNLSDNSELMKNLLEFESEVDKLLGLVEDDKKYAFTGNTRGMVATENTTKVRRKI